MGEVLLDTWLSFTRLLNEKLTDSVHIKDFLHILNKMHQNQLICPSAFAKSFCFTNTHIFTRKPE